MKQKLKTLGIVLLALVGMIVLFITVIGIGNWFQRNEMKIIGNTVMGFFPILTFIAVVLFNRKVNKLSLGETGFNLNRIFVNLGIGIGLAIVLVLLTLWIGKLFLGIPLVFSGLKPGFVTPLLNLMLTLLIVGAWEEFFFRGLVYVTLKQNGFTFHSAAFISSILFSLSHWSSFDMAETSWFWYFGIVFLGYILVYLYAITRSIWTVASFHFVWNILATLVDDKGNEIGLISITDYTTYSIKVDDITVVALGIVLVAMIVGVKTNRFKEHKESTFNLGGE